MMGDTTLVPIMIAMAVGLAVAIAVFGVASVKSPVGVARGRVRALVESDSPYQDGLEQSVSRNRPRQFGWLTEGLGRRANRSTHLALQRSGWPLRVGEYVALRLIALVAVGAGFWFFFITIADATTGIVGAAIGMLVGFALPPILLGIATRRRSAAIERQLVELCELMSSMLRGGYGYVQALSATAAELGQPLGSELMRLVDTARLGADVDDAFEDLNERLNSRDFEMLATAIAIQRRSGGNLAELLEGVAETIRFRQSFKRDLSALTAQARYSAVVVAGIPVVMVIVMNVIDPERYRLLFTHTTGQLMLALAVTLDAVGYFVIKRLSRVEV